MQSFLRVNACLKADLLRATTEEGDRVGAGEEEVRRRMEEVRLEMGRVVEGLEGKVERERERAEREATDARVFRVGAEEERRKMMEEAEELVSGRKANPPWRADDGGGGPRPFTYLFVPLTPDAIMIMMMMT